MRKLLAFMGLGIATLLVLSRVRENGSGAASPEWSGEERSRDTIRGSDRVKPAAPTREDLAPGAPVPAAVQEVAALPGAAGLESLGQDELLLVLANETDDNRRVWALFHLVNRFGVAPQTTGVLYGILGSTDDPALLSAALWGLAQSEEEGAGPAAAAVASASLVPELRLEAVRTLAALGTDSAARALEEILVADPAEQVRAQAAVHLGLTRPGDPVTAAALGQAALEDPEPIVRSAAIDALSASSLPEALAALDAISSRGGLEGERVRAAEHAETARYLAATAGADRTTTFSEPPDPLVAGAQPVR
ncbi:MAG: HEAT repeat domain-containing protein [Planctomycetes bacterium]|nr:HEAT repeat domain-containing protein [Planctomycetota bacterium]